MILTGSLFATTRRQNLFLSPLQTKAKQCSSYSPLNLINRCSSTRQAKQIHAHIITHSNPLAFLSANIVALYAQFDLLDDARQVFDDSPHRNSSILWNSIIRAYLSHRRPLQAIEIYLRIVASGATPDGFTFPLAIRACAALRDRRLCACVHAHAFCFGFRSHLHVGNELVVMYGGLGMMDVARKVFDGMPMRNVVSWNTLISGYSSNFECEEARSVFRMMEVSGTEPNAVTWTALLSAHSRCLRHDEVLSLFDEMRSCGVEATAEVVAVALSVCPYVCVEGLRKGEVIHGYVVKCGFDDCSFVRNSLICMYGKVGNKEDAERIFMNSEGKDLVSWNALLSSYASCGACVEAYEVFRSMEKSDEVTPNVVSWSAVIGGFACSGMYKDSLDMFRQMQQVGVNANSVTIATVLSACAELPALLLGREVHARTIRDLMCHSLLVGNALINMYNKSGSLKDGRCVFDQLKEKDLISWNSMIAGYGMHGLCDEAITTFEEMVGDNCKPDGVTFISILSACSHAGYVSKGRKLFDEMVNEYRLSPTMEHYSCMVDLLGRAGLLSEANDFMEKMPSKPNICVWGALLNSCRIYNDAEVAENTIAHALGLAAETTGNFMLLSNLYAACGRWEDSARVRSMTKYKGLKKNTGQSWIELRNKIYVFSADSKLPSGADDVYIVIEDLYQHMESKKILEEAWEGLENSEIAIN